MSRVPRGRGAACDMLISNCKGESIRLRRGMRRNGLWIRRGLWRMIERRKVELFMHNIMLWQNMGVKGKQVTPNKS